MREPPRRTMTVIISGTAPVYRPYTEPAQHIIPNAVLAMAVTTCSPRITTRRSDGWVTRPPRTTPTRAADSWYTVFPIPASKSVYPNLANKNLEKMGGTGGTGETGAKVEVRERAG